MRMHAAETSLLVARCYIFEYEMVAAWSRTDVRALVALFTLNTNIEILPKRFYFMAYTRQASIV